MPDRRPRTEPRAAWHDTADRGPVRRLTRKMNPTVNTPITSNPAATPNIAPSKANSRTATRSATTSHDGRRDADDITGRTAGRAEHATGSSKLPIIIDPRSWATGHHLPCRQEVTSGVPPPAGRAVEPRPPVRGHQANARQHTVRAPAPGVSRAGGRVPSYSPFSPAASRRGRSTNIVIVPDLLAEALRNTELSDLLDAVRPRVETRPRCWFNGRSSGPSCLLTPTSSGARLARRPVVLATHAMVPIAGDATDPNHLQRLADAVVAGMRSTSPGHNGR